MIDRNVFVTGKGYAINGWHGWRNFIGNVWGGLIADGNGAEGQGPAGEGSDHLVSNNVFWRSSEQNFNGASLIADGTHLLNNVLASSESPSPGTGNPSPVFGSIERVLRGRSRSATPTEGQPSICRRDLVARDLSSIASRASVSDVLTRTADAVAEAGAEAVCGRGCGSGCGHGSGCGLRMRTRMRTRWRASDARPPSPERRSRLAAGAGGAAVIRSARTRPCPAPRRRRRAARRWRTGWAKDRARSREPSTRRLALVGAAGAFPPPPTRPP